MYSQINILTVKSTGVFVYTIKKE